MKETEVKLTKLAKCAGCGAKVGAGTLSKLLDGFKTHYDPKLIVGYDKSDDASVYVINDETALIQTVDFFPPIVDDPFLYGQIAAANSISDIYAMGGKPKLALNVMSVSENMTEETVREVLRGGYEKAYEAGVIITGGHTINSEEPLYGLAVSGFAHPDKILSNSNAKPGDVLILTKKLGVGIITTAAKVDELGGDADEANRLAPKKLMEEVYLQMARLNKSAAEVLGSYHVSSCTDVTGFSLMGHSLEMAQGSDVCINIEASKVPHFEEAIELADMGMIPAGAYRNRDFVGDRVWVDNSINRAITDVMFDPQTSGGLLISIPQEESGECLERLVEVCPDASVIGYVTTKSDEKYSLKLI